MKKQVITIGKRDFEIGKRPYVMGILNVTPDSFSDGGKYGDLDAALKHTEEMIKEGADIIDVGGESTRPGHVKISVAEEIERTCFVIEAIKERFEIPVSLDTYKYQVAQAGILAGADLINDICIQDVTKNVMNAVNNLAEGTQKLLGFVGTDVVDSFATFSGMADSYSNDAGQIDGLVTDFSASSEELLASISGVMEAINEVIVRHWITLLMAIMKASARPIEMIELRIPLK